MTDNAGSKLQIPRWTRRGLLASSGLVGGGLALGIWLPPNRLRLKDSEALSENEVALNTWVKLTPDNHVTVLVPHGEMGQGAGTGLAQMLAEEMEAEWERVRIQQAPVSDNYINSDLGRGYILGEGASIPAFMYRALDFTFLKISSQLVGQMTGGSTAIRLTGHHGMRRAGASAREMLLEAAARKWDVARDDLFAEKSTVYERNGARKASFGELASAAAEATPKLKPRLKSSKDYTIVGRPKRRLDIPAKVDGSAQFGIDVVVEGMRTAAIRHAPVFGARVESLKKPADTSAVSKFKVVELEHAVAVVADSYWEANQALAQVEVSWSGGEDWASTSAIQNAQQEALSQARPEVMDQAGDAETMLASDSALEMSFAVPYLAHATMEPMNCTASVRDGRCEIWVGHQNPMFARNAVAELLGWDPGQITMHPMLMGGGFGRRGKMDFVLEAVQLSQEVGAPVQLVWSREEDMTNDFYRPAITSRMKGLIDKDRLVAMSHRYIDSESGMPDSERPFAFQYSVPNRQIERVKWPSPVPVGTWRSVDFTQMGFFNESFMDEMARTLGQDPMAFRIAHTSDPRRRSVLEKLAKEADWGASLGAGRAQGLALVESFGTVVGQVVDASVDDARRVRVHRVTSVVDCGRVINPDAAVAQIQGSVIYGLTSALFGEITLERGEVQQSNFPAYDMLRLSTAPEQVVHFIASDNPPGGLGEPGVPPSAPALANALCAATGTRARALPLTKAGFRSV